MLAVTDPRLNRTWIENAFYIFAACKTDNVVIFGRL